MSAVSAKINANLLDVVQQERIEEPGAEMSYIVLINMTIRVLPDPSLHWSKCKHDGREQVASEIPEYVTATPHPCFWNPQTFVHQGPEMALKAKKTENICGNKWTKVGNSSNMRATQFILRVLPQFDSNILQCALNWLIHWMPSHPWGFTAMTTKDLLHPSI